MRRTRAWTAALAGTATALALGLTPVSPAGATPDAKSKAPQPASRTSDTRELSPQATKGLTYNRALSRQALLNARAASNGDPKVGDSKVWLALDDFNQQYYLKTFVLRAVAPHLQVWVANDRAFPTDDCRNDLGLTDITPAQINRFKREFTDNMYPVESKVFSVPPDRNGRGSRGLAQQVGLPNDYWKVGKAQSNDIVTLVDNVRDAAYYEPTTPDGQTFIAGFFSPTFKAFLDRNIMTIDSYDWLHRTGANPPDDSGDPAYQACADELDVPASRRFGASRPHDYEGTFAHEYQHLLESDQDADEVNWVNEGVSDWAQSLTGYVDPHVDVASDDADGHMACFSGYLGRRFGGAENSMTLWEDQGPPEILCDYGAAYSFMEYLHSHWGNAIMTKLHRLNANGFKGLDKALDAVGANVTATQVLQRWAAMVALDKPLDGNGGDLTGGPAGAYRAKSLRFHIQWNNPQDYSDGGVLANGSDYVRLVDGAGDRLSAGDINEIDFSGDQGAQPYPVEWTVDATAPDENDPPSDPSDPNDTGSNCDSPPDAGTGGPALYSGCGDNLDRSIVREVSVPTGAGATLSFDSLWDMEAGWDFGMIQVSDDGGKTWTSLETEDTTTEHDPQARADIVDELPGLNGDSGSWQTETADLSQWAGQDVLIGFRYMTDEATAEAGWWLRDVQVGSTTFPNTLDGWETMTQANNEKATWKPMLIAYGAKGDPVYLHRLNLQGGSVSLSGSDLRAAIGDDATTVAVIALRTDATEKQKTPAFYDLQVNGVEQPGSAGVCRVGARC